MIAIAALAAGIMAAGDDGMNWELRNEYLLLQGRGPEVVCMRVDPRGRGRYGRDWLVHLRPRGARAGKECRVRVNGDSVRVDGMVVGSEWRVEVGHGPIADEVLPDRPLGQSFSIPPGEIYAVEVLIPTWHTRTSSATLRLREDGPGGRVIAERRLEKIRDNSWNRLDVRVKGPARLYVELAEPKGRVGWWSRRGSQRGVQGYAGGEPVDVVRAMRVWGWTERAAGWVEYRLDGRRVQMRFGLRPLTGGLHRWDADFRVLWDNSGYDVSRRSVPFWRFFSDNWRYMPTQQLKRWRERDGWYEWRFRGCNWIEADGTDGWDAVFRGRDMGLAWLLLGKETSLVFSLRPEDEGQGGEMRYELEVEVKLADSAIPAEWPRFESNSKLAGEEATIFYWERAFSRRHFWGPAAWFEWNAIAHAWHGGPHLRALRDGLASYPISREGYVHTWGANPGWPFPDNRRYDTRHFDTNARFILACWRYVLWTGDVAFLRAQAERIRRAMEYQLNVLGGRDGLIKTASRDVNGRHGACSNNYWDIIPFGHLDAYANIVWYASVLAMADIEEMLERAGGVKTPQPARGAEFYRRLAEKVRRAFNEAFWDDIKGRYIGCIDIDGREHDYGFTFINLEAMAYGLADEWQVRRIYRWMETEPTSSGKADTYSRWIFAPRATTIHNPRWRPGVGKLEDVPQEPWWQFGWGGTDFGDQCQDGGAILYTSYYDLMARQKFLGPDNAWRRWSEIIARWRMPDHLCGGPPLYRGEIPQQINPAQVGVDMPFPESGMVPCWLVYGVAGLRATLDGLEIRPRLPKALKWLKIRNVGWRGLPLDITVTRDEAIVECRAPGYEFRWRRWLGPDGRVIFRRPPEGIEFPERPLWEKPGPWRAAWIWGEDAQAERAYLRWAFEVPGRPRRAWVAATADNSFVLYVNGRRVGEGDNWARLYRFDITHFLRPGRNVIAAECANEGGPAGFLLQGEVRTADGRRVELQTSGEWRASADAPEGWAEPDFDDSAWRAAIELGRPPCSPWGDIGEPGPPRVVKGK